MLHWLFVWGFQDCTQPHAASNAQSMCKSKGYRCWMVKRHSKIVSISLPLYPQKREGPKCKLQCLKCYTPPRRFQTCLRGGLNRKSLQSTGRRQMYDVTFSRPPPSRNLKSEQWRGCGWKIVTTATFTFSPLPDWIFLFLEFEVWSLDFRILDFGVWIFVRLFLCNFIWKLNGNDTHWRSGKPLKYAARCWNMHKS